MFDRRIFGIEVGLHEAGITFGQGSRAERHNKDNGVVATIISNPGGSLLIHFFWIEDALAHNLDIPLLRIDLPKQAAPIAL